MTLLHAESLSKTFSAGRKAARAPEPAVDAVSFQLERGKTLGIIGESGAGKSTVGRLILRLIEPDRGVLRFQGRDLLALSRRELRRCRQEMQMVFQDPYTSLDPRLPVGVSIAEPLKVHYGTNRSDRECRAKELLQRVGLTGQHSTRYPRHLSGGQLQRVSIARALSLDPAMIVCDEPVAALDVSIRAQILNLLSDVQAETNVGYIFIAHDLAVVEHFADELIVMRRGRVVEAGRTKAIFSEAKHDYTEELLTSMKRMSLQPTEEVGGV